MQALKKMSEKQPHAPWLIGSGIVSLAMLIAIVTVAMGEPLQVAPPPLAPSDWIIAIGMGLAIPATILTYWGLQFLPQPKPRLQAPASERPIVFNGPAPELVNRLKAERDAWKRKAEELQARQSAPDASVSRETETGQPHGRELTYGAVAALLRAGNVGIKRGREIVRENGGAVGREGYEQLKIILSLLPSPTAEESPFTDEKPTVNREPRRVNRRTRTRNLPRKGRGW